MVILRVPITQEFLCLRCLCSQLSSCVLNTYASEFQHVSHGITTRIPQHHNKSPTESQRVSHGISTRIPRNHTTTESQHVFHGISAHHHHSHYHHHHYFKDRNVGGEKSFSPRAYLYYTLAEHFDLLYFLVTSGSRRKAAVYLLSVCLHYSLQINFFIFIRIIKILVSKLRAHQMRYSDYKFR